MLLEISVTSSHRRTKRDRRIPKSRRPCRPRTCIGTFREPTYAECPFVQPPALSGSESKEKNRRDLQSPRPDFGPSPSILPEQVRPVGILSQLSSNNKFVYGRVEGSIEPLRSSKGLISLEKFRGSLIDGTALLMFS